MERIKPLWSFTTIKTKKHWTWNVVLLYDLDAKYVSVTHGCHDPGCTLSNVPSNATQFVGGGGEEISTAQR